MLKTVQYYSNQERELLLLDNSDLILVEEKNIIEGNFLVFSDVPIEEKIITIYTNVPEEEFNSLKAENKALSETVDSILTDIIPSLLP